MPDEARETDEMLPPAYRDPKGFLREERFHRSMQFTPSYFALEDASTVAAAGAREQHTVTYAVAGSTDPAAPTLVWINGMGAHRLAAMLMDGLFAAHGVRLLTLDRPSAGKSTPCPLAHRQSTSLDSLVAVLAQEGLTSFSILSHSNGLLYTLYTLLHLPPHLHVRSWTLSSPYVPPWLSGSALLSAARWVPPLLTSRLGAIAGAAQRVLDPLSRSAGWSAGVVRDLSSGAAAWSSSSGFVSLGTAATASPPAATAPPADEPDPEQLPPPKQLARFRRVNAQRAPHRRLFGGEYVPPGLFNAGMKVALDEGLDAMGLEAMVCLRQGEGARWGWGEDGDDRDESKLFERGFAALKRRWDAGGAEARVEMSVWVPDDDGLVPKQGHEYLRALLVDQLALVEPREWHVVEDAGHDDTLARTCVMEPLLGKVVRVHREEAAAAQ
ncbi:alpha/beta fold hydrolase [Rhodotorula paludigena]|uniref:alpha/beta fold hydrolase n=1 Tax=Rhodotorula paludigena TaxID=86838 RepID=UPI0031706E79